MESYRLSLNSGPEHINRLLFEKADFLMDSQLSSTLVKLKRTKALVKTDTFATISKVKDFEKGSLSNVDRCKRRRLKTVTEKASCTVTSTDLRFADV